MSKVYSFAPGMAMRYGGDNRFQEEVSPSVTAATGDNRLAVAFTQNTRDEVRLIGGDGATVGALSAGGGMHQTNYVAEIEGPPRLIRVLHLPTN